MMGISVASLFGYRNGSIEISNKAWSKLERFEKSLLEQNAQKEGNPKYLQAAGEIIMREEPPPYGTPKPLSLDARVERLERVLEGILEVLKKL